jgi:menaquinone-dependent protoporphyrinogen oxidase
MLKGADRDVDIVNLRETRKPDLGKYGAVVIGSGVRLGRWYGPAKKLLKRKELASKKVALFVACGMACEKAKREEAMFNYIAPMAAKHALNPVSMRAFPGSLPGKAGGPVSTSGSEAWGRELAGLL